MIHVLASITVKPSQRDAFVAAFKQLVPEVLAEDGCIAYSPNIDTPTGLDAQSPVDENRVMVIEQWQSVEHLKAHLVAPHMQAFREKNGELVESMTLQICEPA
jgi:quinol monooxygenase YgiN